MLTGPTFHTKGNAEEDAKKRVNSCMYVSGKHLVEKIVDVGFQTACLL
jgi:hypothetical protein